jgi:2'-hydroxyisoflavone reductase
VPVRILILGGTKFLGRQRPPRAGGTFNLVGDPLSFGKFLRECQAATYSDAELRWIPGAALTAAGVSPDMGIPLWIGDPEEALGFNDVSNARALAAGLTLRPALETIRDTLAWDAGRGGPGPGKEGLSAAEEERLLRELA